jgi:hypothetical protein
MGPIITIETATTIDRRYPSYCVTRYEVLEDGDVISSFSDPETAEWFAMDHAKRVGGIVDWSLDAPGAQIPFHG